MLFISPSYSFSFFKMILLQDAGILYELKTDVFQRKSYNMSPFYCDSFALEQ